MKSKALQLTTLSELRKTMKSVSMVEQKKRSSM